MNALVSQVLTFFSTAREQRRGVVHRVGPWFGPGEAHGMVLVLRGDPKCYVVLRDSHECVYPAGLTQAGDTVVFQASADGVVSLSRFRNLTLDAESARQEQR